VDEFMQVAIEEAKEGLREGGIPIGSVLVKDAKIIGRGQGRLVPRRRALFHVNALLFMRRSGGAVWYWQGYCRRVPYICRGKGVYGISRSPGG